MTEYLTEQEQIEILKNWIKQYSLVILAGVAMAALIISGWRYWQARQDNILNHASAVYDEMLTMRAQNNSTATLVQAEKLFSHYPKTTYGQMAAFMLARNAVTFKDYAKAETHLRWIIKHSSIPSFRQIARIRLARVLIADNNAAESIKVLDKIDDKSFNGFTNEIKGDAYLSLNDTVKARQAYAQALRELPNAETVRPLLQMKYDNLTTASESTSES